MDHLVMESELTECKLGSRPERSKRVKERQRKISLLNLWKVRTPLKISAGGMLSSSKEVQVHSTQRKFTTFTSILRINPFRPYCLINSASAQCGSIATVLSSSDQVGGLSGQRLNINSLSDSCDLDSGIMGQEICASFPYSIGSSLPCHLQEPWAALIDSGAVT